MEKKYTEVKDMKQGEIFRGEENHKGTSPHFMIFYKAINEKDFEGGMISSTDYKGKNKIMEKCHFEEGGISFKEDKGSHLVKALLHKLYDMGEFEKVGQLTDKGIEFMKETLEPLPLVSWEEYLKRVKDGSYP